MDNPQQLYVLDNAKTTGAQGQLVEASNKKSDNSGGGEPPMDKDKYVTHEELDHAIDNVSSEVKLSTEEMLHKMDNHFAEMQSKMDNKFANMQNQFRDIDKKIDLTNEKINTKFEKQKVWFYGTGIAIVSITCTIIGFLIKFIK